MADLMISSSPVLKMTTTTTPTVAASTGGGVGLVVADSPSVTTGGSSASSVTTSGGVVVGATSPSLANGKTVIPHPQNSSSSNNNNGHEMSFIGDDNNSSSHNNNSHHHQPHHKHSNQNCIVSSCSTTTSSASSPSVGLLQHHRNHSHPLVFSSRANNSSSNHVDSSSSSSAEMAMAIDGGSGGAAVVNSSVVTTLPSSSSTTATTMDILNLDFVNGNSSYCHSTGSNNERGTTSPLSQWSHHQSSNAACATGGGSRTNADLRLANSSSDHHRDLQSSVTLNPSTNNSSTGGDSATTPIQTSVKIPGEIPEFVMKYLLTKSDSVDSTKSSHSSSGNSPLSASQLAATAANTVPMSISAPSSSDHRHQTTNKRLQEFLVDLDTLQSTTEIAKVLENFNAILEKIEQEDDKEALEGLEALATPLSPSVLHCPTATVSSTSRIKNSVETLAELLLSGCGEEEDEDLLIIIDENDSESLQAGVPLQNNNGILGACGGSSNNNKSVDVSVFIEDDYSRAEEEELDEGDDVSSLVEIETDLGDLDQEEGYESDRPIVRASMRKLRPVKLLPMPSSSSHHHPQHHHHQQNINNCSSCGNANAAFSTPPPTPVTPRANSPVDPNVGLAATLHSPTANKIIVTSLMNNLNAPSPQSNSPNINSNINVECTVVSNSAQQRTSVDNLLTVPSSSSQATATCSSSVINSNGNSYVPTLDVLHVASGSSSGGGSGVSNSGNNSQSRCHSRNQSNSSQIVQFHQNPVTITSHPSGFVEVSIGNASTSTSNSTQSTSGNGNSGVQQQRGVSNSGNSAETSSSNETSSGCGISRDSCGAGTASANATGGGDTTTNSPGVSASTPNRSNGNSAASNANNNSTTRTSGNASTNAATGGNSGTNNSSNGARSRPRAPQAPTAQQQRSNPAVLRVPAGRWPHRLSSVLAVIGCTLGLNNICRFSLLSVQYGANFILQFIFLSLVFGIPLLTFHMSIGQYLSSGIIDMWKISPIFQGIGVGLVISQAMIGIYTTVGVSWIFIYFRDSFITRSDQYRWGKCVREFGDCDPNSAGYSNGTSSFFNETVPDYFNAVVLQRTTPGYPDSAYVPSSLKFTVAFNLAVVWMLVFVSLSKGLKSYGKVVHGFVLAPVAALFVLAFKMVNLVQAGGSLFGQTQWSNFFFSSQTWVAAARETFFTWGLLGACVMQITAHNRHSHSLKSDSLIVIMVTMIVLMLSAFIGNACYSILTSPGTVAHTEQFSYVPSSFESKNSYRFLEAQDPESSVTDMYDHQHISFLMGVRITKQGSDFHQRSGYQVLRLATELFPATMAVLSQTAGMSSFWTVLFYFAFVLFGIAQQIAIWHCVIKGIIAVKGKVLRSWETTITFFVCGLGFVLGLPLCTETGIFIEYFMDYAIGSGWWIMVLYLLELIAVFIVRGAPYCGENIVTVLITGRNRIAAVLAPLISFIWNVIMPVAILVLSIASFKSGNIRELYDWNPKHGYRFWPLWTRELGSLIQLVPILAVPFVAILQSCRYLSSGPPDLFDRMQQLYRPNSQGIFGNTLSGSFNENGSTDSGSRNGNSSRGPEDPPPKYTPPPSYSTATGAKIAKFLRNSFRRSIRRLSSPSGGPSTSSASPDNLPPPPNYASVILEINSQRVHPSSSCAQATATGSGSIMNPIMVPPPTYDESTMSGPTISSNGHHSKGTNTKPGESSEGANKLYQIQLSQTLGRSLAEGSKERASLRRIASDITSRDIARMLRASLRRANRDFSEASTSSAIPHGASSSYSASSSPGQGITVTIPASSNIPEGSNGTPCEYTFGPSSIEKVEYDLEMLNDIGHASDGQHSSSAIPSTSAAMTGGYNNRPGTSSASAAFGFNFGFNRARNRNSNDSQLALITNGVYEDLSVTSGSLMGALVDGEIEIDQFTQLNLPRRDSLSQLNVLDLRQQGNVNPTFQIHNANITTTAQVVERQDRAADSEA